MYFNLHGKVAIDTSGVRLERYRGYLRDHWGAFAAQALPAAPPLIELCEAKSLAAAGGEHKFGQFHHSDSRLLYRSEFPPYKRIALRIGRRSARIEFEPGILEEELHKFLDFAIRQLALLSGAAFIHSSAVSLGGLAHVFPGWGGIGKSALLMDLLRHGAQYLGDDLVMVDESGIYPYPLPLNLLHYNLAEHFELLQPVSNPRALRYHRLLGWLNRVRGPWSAGTSLPARVYRNVVAIVSGRTHQHLDAGRIFPRTAPAPLARIADYRVYYLERSIGGDIEPRKLDIGLYARKMKHCLRWERASHYGDLVTALLYAFPDREQEFADLYDGERRVIESFFRNARSAESLAVGEGIPTARLAQRIAELAGFKA